MVCTGRENNIGEFRLIESDIYRRAQTAPGRRGAANLDEPPEPVQVDGRVPVAGLDRPEIESGGLSRGRGGDLSYPLIEGKGTVVFVQIRKNVSETSENAESHAPPGGAISHSEEHGPANYIRTGTQLVKPDGAFGNHQW